MLGQEVNDEIEFSVVSVDDVIALTSQGVAVIQGKVLSKGRNYYKEPYVEILGVGEVTLTHTVPSSENLSGVEYLNYGIVRILEAPKAPDMDDYRIIDDGEGGLWQVIATGKNNILTRVEDRKLIHHSDRGKYGSHSWYTTKTQLNNLTFKRKYPKWKYIEWEQISGGKRY